MCLSQDLSDIAKFFQYKKYFPHYMFWGALVFFYRDKQRVKAAFFLTKIWVAT